MLTLNKLNLSIFIIWLFAVSAIIGIYLGHVNWFITKTPLNLAIGAGLLFWTLPIDSLRKFGVWFIAFSIGMIVEILGVQTGDIFGNYYYGDNLGLKLMGVPYMIGVNWAVLSVITSAIGTRLNKSFWGSILIGTCLMVGLDFLLEPLAGIFDFWHFEGGIVPIQNFVAWFVTAFILQIFIRKTLDIEKSAFSTHLLLSQVFFFGSCYLIIKGA